MKLRRTTSFSFVMRVFGHDRMNRGFDPNCESCRVPSVPHSPLGMEQPF